MYANFWAGTVQGGGNCHVSVAQGAIATDNAFGPTDAASGIASKVNMSKSIYVVGEPIIAELVLKNQTDETISAYHESGAAEVLNASEPAANAGRGFDLGDELRPRSRSSVYGMIDPGQLFKTIFALAGAGSHVEPGNYRVRIHVTILRSMSDRVPIGEITTPYAAFSVSRGRS